MIKRKYLRCDTTTIADLYYEEMRMKLSIALTPIMK